MQVIQKSFKNLESSLILKVESFRTYSDVTKGAWAGLEGADPEFFKKDGCDWGAWLHTVTVLTGRSLRRVAG